MADTVKLKHPDAPDKSKTVVRSALESYEARGWVEDKGEAPKGKKSTTTADTSAESEK